MKIKILFATLLLMACEKANTPGNSIVFTGEQAVKVEGYTDDLMEPFMSRDGSTLFFNNLNDPSVDTNLHWAIKVNDSTFSYQGLLQGANSTSLDAVASMDKNGIFYFVSTRSYTQSLSSIYSSNYANGSVTNVGLVMGISKNQAGWVNFDAEVDATGETLYFVDGQFDQSGGPYQSDIVIATKNTTTFQRSPNSTEILNNVNTSSLEYAPCTSANGLELYFTRVNSPLTASSMPEIFVAARLNTSEAFGTPSRIQSITGFAEAPTISSDGNLIYYHKKVNGKYSLFLTRRQN